MPALPVALLLSCVTTSKERAPAESSQAPSEAPVKNPLLDPWSGPYGGVPPFDAVTVGGLEAALEAAMAQNRREVEEIATRTDPPTFENTLVALERSGQALDRLQTLFGVYASTLSTPQIQALERRLAPKLQALSDEIVQNAALFARIDAVYSQREALGLTPEQQRLAWLYHKDFVRAGAQLDSPRKQRLAELNKRLVTLYTQFSQNVLSDEEQRMVVLTSEVELAGLPESVKAGAATDAAARQRSGGWVIANTRSAVEPFLRYSSRRDLREKVWRQFVDRGDNGDERDNNALIAEILSLRLERARLLGYPTHAHWRLENAMAKTPERALELMEKVWPAALARAREEIADMQRVADQEAKRAKQPRFQIEPWDYRYYAEKVRKARYDLDENELKPYLELERLREGMFWVAGELFGFEFSPAPDATVYHPDVRVWKVTQRASGALVGLWYFDPYARPGKRSGAWMNRYRSQERLHGDVKTIVSNNSNFMKAAPGQPVLISWDDAETLFHEFGHALHGLASNVTYPSLSGTAVARDYVEFPSQLLEHWLSTDQVLQRFAVHHQTQAPMPRSLMERLKRAATFNQGFATVEYLASALIDMKLHLEQAHPIDPDAFERATLAELGMPRQIVMRHRTPHFGHVFGGDGYSAGYYSYLWSDTLTADAYEGFEEANGPFDPAVAQRLRAHVFSVGNTVDPADGYRAFRGRDPSIDALMRKRGFADGRKGGSQGARP